MPSSRGTRIFIPRIPSNNLVDGNLSLTLEGRIVARRSHTGARPIIPRLTIRKEPDNGLTLSWGARIGTTYLLERSDNLERWIPVTRTVSFEEDYFHWSVDATATNSYFRVRPVD